MQGWFSSPDPVKLVGLYKPLRHCLALLAAVYWRKKWKNKVEGQDCLSASHNFEAYLMTTSCTTLAFILSSGVEGRNAGVTQLQELHTECLTRFPFSVESQQVQASRCWRPLNKGCVCEILSQSGGVKYARSSCSTCERCCFCSCRINVVNTRLTTAAWWQKAPNKRSGGQGKDNTFQRTENPMASIQAPILSYFLAPM